jgi:polysaccharide export outer membrane protein
MKTLVGALCCMALSVTAWAQASPKEAAMTAAAVAAASDAYHVGPEDVLEISVWKENDLSKKEVLIRPDGGLSFPLIGEVQASGHSVAEIQKEITAKLQKFIPDPVVSVALTKIQYQRVYVIGKVTKPGEFSMTRPIDVLQALAMAAGMTPYAATNDVKIVRRQQGKLIALPFRYSDVERGERLEQNVLLQPGDVVVVP